ncbi:uncharacterized protein EAE97_004099 [Botrytis byssoidea]|uniref:Uncharacterized protein n=1 Tax=Botrytis byssoidea TaxID=139641 RepID=A0A9P5M6C9_9HELO|nr:uncharacterized protein EAE97_004099 [Botrytis byssoidea]KAF7946850.1 hypothetical protein EAE97_004099 [Botrytis byssoidea]
MMLTKVISVVLVAAADVVSQAALGVGRQTGYAFTEAGAVTVVFADIDSEGTKTSAEKSEKLAANSKYQYFAVQVDFADADGIKSMVD